MAEQAKRQVRPKVTQEKETSKKIAGLDRTSVDLTPEEAQQQATKEEPKGAFSDLSRSLDEKSLGNPAIGKILLDLNDNLTKENKKLDQYRNDYYGADRKVGILESKLEGENKFLVLFTLCLTIGGILFGSSFTATGVSSKILLWSGIILMAIPCLLQIKPIRDFTEKLLRKN